MTKSVSYEHLLQLAQQRAIDGKGGLAASLAKMCLDADTQLSESELALAYQILRELIGKVEMQIRRQVADYLADRGDVPRDLIDFLLDDAVHVAFPIIVRSPQLTDEDLLDLIERKGRGHALAVAKRPGLDAVVGDRLVGLCDAEVDHALLRNTRTALSRSSIEKLVERSIDSPDYQPLIVERPDLPDDLARRMYIWVSDALRQHLARNFNIDETTLDQALDAAVWQVLDSAPPDARPGFDTDSRGGRPDARPGFDDEDEGKGDTAPAEPEDPGTALRRQAAELIRTLEREGPRAFINTYARQTGLEPATAAEIFDSETPEAVAIACKAMRMDIDRFVAVLHAFVRPEEWDAFVGDGRLDRACAYYDRIDAVGAATVVRHWREGTSSVRPRRH